VNLIVRPSASADIAEAHSWYELQRPGLGDEFAEDLRRTFQVIEEHPRRYRIAHRDARRAMLTRFPYAVFYRVLGDFAVVIACFHASRDPRHWQIRQ
jgi:plasmid stabilization system protein ParE